MRKHLNKLRVKLIGIMLLFRFSQKIIGKKWVKRWSKNYILAEKELSVLPRILDENSIVFDIGANRGEISYFLSVGCAAKKVYSFEPQDRMFGILLGVAEKIKKIIPIKIAFSDVISSKKILNIPLKGIMRYSQEASLENTNHKKTVGEKVNADTVDNFVSKNNITRLDFIKCDTEGHELAIFRGAQKTLNSLRPVLFVEVKESNKKDFLVLMERSRFKPYQPADETSENYYFFPIEKEAAIIESIKSK